MFEKVNPGHPDKLADRIAGALVDMAYRAEEAPRIAVEVLLGHGTCTIIAETSTHLDRDEVARAVHRIAGPCQVVYNEVAQDEHLAGNQEGAIRCGDNGIFRGCPVTDEQESLSGLMRELWHFYPTDGKAVLDGGELVVCQSNAPAAMVARKAALRGRFTEVHVNPLGDWTGGPDVDAGATNRKLGSDMGDAVTGGGLHGKDLSKADVSVNIVCHLFAQEDDREIVASCAIGDEVVEFRYPGNAIGTVLPYSRVVDMAQEHVRKLGGFEKLAEWGLV